MFNNVRPEPVAKNLGGHLVPSTPCFLNPAPAIIVPAMKDYYVYIMTNRSKTLYVGVTNNLTRRVYEHKHMLKEGFTRRYRIDRLVYYEATNDVEGAISREKQIKGWVRRRKITLIESANPTWRDLSDDF